MLFTECASTVTCPFSRGFCAITTYINIGRLLYLKEANVSVVCFPSLYWWASRVFLYTRSLSYTRDGHVSVLVDDVFQIQGFCNKPDLYDVKLELYKKLQCDILVYRSWFWSSQVWLLTSSIIQMIIFFVCLTLNISLCSLVFLQVIIYSLFSSGLMSCPCVSSWRWVKPVSSVHGVTHNPVLRL